MLEVLELVLVTTPLALEVLDATDELDEAAAEELEELELLVRVAEALAEAEAEAEKVMQAQAELTAVTSPLQLAKSVGMAAGSVVVLARNSGQKL
jgi:hypothetical protein